MMPDGDTVLPKAVANLTYFGNAMTGDSQVIDGEYALPMVVPEGPFRLEVSTGAVSCTNNEDDCALPVELFGTLRGQIVAGEELDMDIRLLGVGDVRVRVEGPDNLPVVGASVTLTTAFPRDGAPQVQLTDIDGNVTFRHVVEGPYAVEAKLFGTPRWASMRASMLENPPLTHQDSLTLVLPTVDGAGGGDACQVFGTISGRILDENDQIVSEPTSVTLFAGANVAMTLSDTSDGTYRFENDSSG